MKWIRPSYSNQGDEVYVNLKKWFLFEFVSDFYYARAGGRGLLKIKKKKKKIIPRSCSVFCV